MSAANESHRTGVPDLHTDELPPLGKGEGPNPDRLLTAAIGNCLAASLLFCLGRARIDVAGLTATVEMTVGRNAEGRERMGRCLEIFESFCTVTESVRQGIDVRVSVEPAGGA